MTALIQASFDSPEETRNFDPPSSGHLDLVADGKVGRGTFNPGWRWSVNVKPIAAPSCASRLTSATWSRAG